MEAVICDTVHGRDEFAALPDELKKRFISDARATVAVQSKRTEDFSRIYRELREKGLSPLVVKGISCRRLWKNPDARPSGDEDLLIRPEWLGDVLAVMEAVREAADRARRGEGPTLIEAKTYRYLGHSKSDKRIYRSREEEEE